MAGQVLEEPLEEFEAVIQQRGIIAENLFDLSHSATEAAARVLQLLGRLWRQTLGEEVKGNHRRRHPQDTSRLFLKADPSQAKGLGVAGRNVLPLQGLVQGMFLVPQESLAHGPQRTQGRFQLGFFPRDVLKAQSS